MFLDAVLEFVFFVMPFFGFAIFALVHTKDDYRGVVIAILVVGYLVCHGLKNVADAVKENSSTKGGEKK